MVSEKICTGSIKGDGDKRLQTPETPIEANHRHGDGEKKVSIHYKVPETSWQADLSFSHSARHSICSKCGMLIYALFI